MKILFMGSGELACPTVDALLKSPTDELIAAVTQPDRPSGRALKPTSCPACVVAREAGLPVLMPDRIRDTDVLARIADLRPDVIVVAAYGQFLPRALLDLPPRGCINVHPSLLPKYRGAAPIQWAIANGDTETGVTILKMTVQMDAGDILRQVTEPIRPEDTTATLSPRLAKRGAALVLEVLNDLRAGPVTGIPQDPAGVVLAPLIRKEDGWIRWKMPARQIADRIRGFCPWPGSSCEAPDGRRLKIHAVSLCADSNAPGRVIRFDAERGDPVVAAAVGSLVLREVQPEGGRRMSGAEYARGARWAEGVQLVVT